MSPTLSTWRRRLFESGSVTGLLTSQVQYPKLPRRAIYRRQKDKQSSPPCGVSPSPPSVSSSPPALIFNSSLFPSSAAAALSPPPQAPASPPHHSRAMSPLSPPIFSSLHSSANFPPFLTRPTYSHPTTNTSFTTNTNHGFQKFDPSVVKFEGSPGVPNHFETKFAGLQSPYDSARISKFEPRFEPNLTNESSQLCQTSRSGQNSESLMVQNGQCGTIP